MTVLSLCPLTEADLTAAVTLDQRCFGGLWTIDGYRRELDSPNSEILTLQSTINPATIHQIDIHQTDIHQTDNYLIGLGCYWAILEEAHITILAVDPHHQQQGLGFTLLWALLNSAVYRGLERATLEVRISNQSALQLYEKFGFKVAGKRRRYYQDTGEDALVLWRGGLQLEAFQESLSSWRQQACDRLHHFNWQLITPNDGHLRSNFFPIRP